VDEPASLRVAAADLSDLAAIRAFVWNTATALDASADAVPDLVLAVDEAVTNIIRHGYGGRPGPIGIEVERDDAAIVVHVTDEAAPFDPTTWPEPDLDVPLERRAAGGLGIHLVRTSVDRLAHRAAADRGNELILVKVDGGREGTATMNTTVDRIDGRVPVAVLRLDGDLDSSNFEALIEEGRRLYAEGARDLLLDMRQVPYMGSSGLVAIHSLVLIFNGAEPPGPDAGWEAHHAIGRSVEAGMQPHVKVLLAADSSPISRVLDRTGMNRFIDVRTDEGDALAAF